MTGGGVNGTEPEAVGRRIAQLRNERGLSQKALADLAGLSTSTLLSYEKGRSRVPVGSQLERLADALQASAVFILTGSEEADAALVTLNKQAQVIAETLERLQQQVVELRQQQDEIGSVLLRVVERLADHSEGQVRRADAVWARKLGLRPPPRTGRARTRPRQSDP